VALQVRQNGDLHVTENITYHFGGATASGSAARSTMASSARFRSAGMPTPGTTE
jgi:hypothetical protein